MVTLLSFAFVLGLLIFVHELGHFVTAKMVGIRVERFSLGFPPRMIGKKIGDTDYCISWLPLGGYVKMAGMIDESLDDNIKGEPWEYQSKPVWQRIVVITAGSAMNILTAVVIFAGIAFFLGHEVPKAVRVSEVVKDAPAEMIGLKSGDVITSVDGDAVVTISDLVDVVSQKAGQEIAITWDRDGAEFSSVVTPYLDEEYNIGRIGIKIEKVTAREKLGLFESISYGTETSYIVVVEVSKSLWSLIAGEAKLKESVGGPLAIMAFAGQSARHGFDKLLEFTALISLNLGFFNMLPFPVLDGGHLVLLLLEGIMRKPLPTKTRVTIQKVGMVFLLALMIFVFVNDINRWPSLPF
jgi:regulator of sigma E protease